MKAAITEEGRSDTRSVPSQWDKLHSSLSANIDPADRAAFARCFRRWSKVFAYSSYVRCIKNGTVLLFPLTEDL